MSTGFGLVNGLIDHLYTRLVSTSNYSATANPHTSHITTAFAKSFSAYVFTSRFLVKASNSGDSSVSALKSSLHRFPYRTDSQLTKLPCL
jgi:hypothetical protein